MKVSLHELMNMLKTIESTFKKKKPVLLVGSSSNSKDIKPKKWKGKKGNGSFKKNIKKGVQGRGKKSQAQYKCHNYSKLGHWKGIARISLQTAKMVMARSKELSEESTVLKLGNGVVVATLAIGMVHLVIGIIVL
ncbi:UNVERIFIED_CONTAM: hypothetical protein Sradi_1295200 [Sesamum radiatum]|uniref:Uncharacterized protein n=1 Tax=Sesamum radiatum TaxID=300843 RepID=A0AAW2UR02_SESRA